MIELSNKAKAICDAHFHPTAKGYGCGSCPLQQVCIADVRCTRDGIDAWTQRCNDAAEKLNNDNLEDAA